VPLLSNLKDFELSPRLEVRWGFDLGNTSKLANGGQAPLGVATAVVKRPWISSGSKTPHRLPNQLSWFQTPT
jgi:hypothetical protein